MDTTQQREHFTGSPGIVDIDELRTEVQHKYAEVATDPGAGFHFHTGRFNAANCRYDTDAVGALPDVAVESFAGVANPFEPRPLVPGERVVELGSGAGLDCFLAARAVGAEGAVVGVDMTPAMLEKARTTAAVLGLDNVTFEQGYIEDVPVPDGWADVVIANGVINLSPAKREVFAEAFRVLAPGGHLQFADIAVGQPVPSDAQRHINLWTDCIAGGQSCDEWRALVADAGFVDVRIGEPVDTFRAAGGEVNARRFEVFGYPIIARRPA